MKKAILTIIGLLIAMPTFAQVLDDYVDSQKGDTLVIKDYYDMSNEAGTLFKAIQLDNSAPAGRVYELKAGGWYPFSEAIAGISRPLVIVGSDATLMVANDGSTVPPLITGYTDGTTSNNNLIQFADDIILKNVQMLPAVNDGSFGWAGIGPTVANKTIIMDNVLMETTKWVEIQSNDYPGTSVIITNSYFVNLVGQACRRNGGVYDNVSNPTEKMWVENTTHVMAQGMMYKFRNFPVPTGGAFFNHNTFVNCSGQIFETVGYLSNFIVTNNLFVNSNIQPYSPGLDFGETDIDSMAMGLINVAPLPSDTGLYAGLTEAGRKALVHANGVYWNMDKVGGLAADANTGQVNGKTDWVQQTITMNNRTQTMFDNAAAYPLLNEGTWIEGGDPAFTDPRDLMTDALDALVDFTSLTIEDNNPATLDWWRAPGNSATADNFANFIYPDWPIPVDLSYTNTAYLTGGVGGFPVGDLNWFPAKKADWEAQKDAEHAALAEALNNGTLPVTPGNRVTNGSFEQATVGPVVDGIDGWSLQVGSSVDPAPDFEIVTDPVQEGSYALAITVNALGTNAWDIQLAAERIPVTPGNTYDYSVWAKTSDAGGSKASFTVGNAEYSEYMRLHEQSLTTEWTEFTGSFTITDDYTVVRAPIHFSIAGNVGDTIYIDNLKITPSTTSVEQIQALPTKYVLSQNYPNPFNPTTTISFSVPKSGNVTLKVYNIMGREVATLVDGFKAAAPTPYKVNFDASSLASGVYFYTIEANGYKASKKMLLIK